MRQTYPACWQWLFRPQYEPDTNSTVGYLQIARTVYHCRETHFEHDDGSGGRLWQLTKHDGTRYQLCADPVVGALRCDCPEATFHDRPCKHAKAVLAAFRFVDAFRVLWEA